MNLAPILDDCLQRLQAGETIAGCLACYPDQAADLAPMLAVAAQLSGLAGQAPSAAQRQHTLARLRQEAASQRASQRGQARTGWLTPIFAARRLAVAAAVVLLLLATLSAGVVASSQPGQPAYGLRILAERAPAWIAFGPTARAAAELNVADRRLSDLQAYLISAEQVEPAALRAMLAGDRAAARQALRAGETERQQVAARLAVHARLLADLAAAAADPAAAQALAAAAHNTWSLVAQLQANPAGQAPLPIPPGGSVADPSDLSLTPTASPTPTPTATGAMATLTTGEASPTHVATPGLRPTSRPGPQPPAPGQTATAQAQTPPPQQTSRPPTPGQTATAQAQTPPPQQTSRPPAPGQTATAQAQTPPPGSSPAATPAEPQPTATRPAGPDSTPGGQPTPPSGLTRIPGRP